MTTTKKTQPKTFKSTNTFLRWPQGILVIALLSASGAFAIRQCHRGATPQSPHTNARSTRVTPPIGAARPTAPATAQAHASVANAPTATSAISGHVYDETRKPLANATVCADTVSNDYRRHPTCDPVCTMTDAAGAYTLPALPAATYSLDAGAPAHLPATWSASSPSAAPSPASNNQTAPAEAAAPSDSPSDELRLQAGETRTGIDFVLATGGVALQGTVVDINGGIIVDAMVRAVPQSGSNRASIVAHTDERGHFTLWTPPGSLRVIASAAGYTEVKRFANAPGSVAIALSPGSQLGGRVTAAGAPVTNAIVTLSTLKGPVDERTTTTDHLGNYVFTGLWPGRYRVRATSPTGAARHAQSVVLGVGQARVDINLALQPAYRIAGTVSVQTATDLVPCRNGELAVVHNAGVSDWVALTGHGAYEIWGLAPGAFTLRAQCTSPMGATAERRLTVDTRDLVNQAFALDGRHMSSLWGKVHTRDGHLITEGDIYLFSTSPGAGAPLQTHIDSQGRYRFAAVKPDDYSMLVRSAQAERRPPLLVTVAATPTRFDLTVERGTALSVHVVDTDGKPMANVQVLISPDNEQTASATNVITNQQGEAAATQLLATGYTLTLEGAHAHRPFVMSGRATDPAVAHHVMLRENQSETATLMLAPATGIIRGSVVDASGAAVNDAYVFVAPAVAAQARNDAIGIFNAGNSMDVASELATLTDEDGKFTLTGLAPGYVALHALRADGSEARDLAVAVGSVTKLVMERPAHLHGDVVMANGQPLADFTVTIVGGASFFRREPFSRGVFEMEGLAPGSYRVALAAEGAVCKRAENVELRAGVTTHLKVECTPAP